MSSERFIEATGSSVEEAIAKGLEQLGVGPNDVIVEVLEEASRGMFGLTSRPARVRLQLLVQRAAPPPPPPPPPPAPAAPVPAAPVMRTVVDEDDDADDFGDGVLSDEDAEVARVVLGEILEKLSIRANISVRRAESGEDEDDAPWLLNVTGSGDLSVLIGKRGETLASLQYLTRLITSREIQRRANIVVDVDSYKARRTSKLQELALRMAEQAVREQRTISLEPMPPYERRIIHMVLRDRTDVSTESVGEGTARKITIVPNK
jgi:spoIIIJ-associated protein